MVSLVKSIYIGNNRQLKQKSFMEHCGDHNLDDWLETLEMLDCDGGQVPGLVFTSDQPGNPAVRFSLEQARHYGADAVFFRTYPEGDKRSPLPQIYIYNNTSLTLAPNKYAEAHRRLWNAGLVPLMFIFTASEIKVLNCRQEPKLNETTGRPCFSPFAKLQKLIQVKQAFVTRAIATGTIWDDPKFKTDFALEKTAYYKLLSHLQLFKNQLMEQGILSETVVNRLLVMSILVKYLDERRDGNGGRVFRTGFFRQFSQQGNDDFASLFREVGSCLKLFDHLCKHFNGRIFELSHLERHELGQTDLTSVADFLTGDQEPTGQKLFWPLYSFEDLPIELISNIYEEFLAHKEKIKGKGITKKKTRSKSKGVVYTPPLLVDFLLDQCLPLSPDSLKWKILDPACGSGVFLVGTFKRLIHCWRMAHNWQKPTLADLKTLLRNNIFGFDKEPEAILIAAFSLCVALCNELDPLVIWNDLRFDDLRSHNLQAKDFFEIVESGRFENHFDLIIGNPPFDSELKTEAAQRIEASASQSRPQLPDQQIALLFLEQSFRLCRPEATVCLLQPASPLLYNINSQSFRGYVFSSHQVRCVFDFTALEGVLFQKAKVASAAILIRNTAASENKILQMTFRRTRAIKEKLVFEVDPYDFHWISQDAAINNPYVWKTNLLGGGRLHQLLERFTKVPTLGAYLREKQEHDGWEFCEGFSIGCGSYLNEADNAKELLHLTPKERKSRFKLARTPEAADWLTGKINVPPTALTQQGLEWQRVEKCKDVYFERPRSNKRKIFSPPHVLIREAVDGTAIPAYFSLDQLVFSKQIFGVHAPIQDTARLQELAIRLNDSGIYGVLAALTSSRMLVTRANSLLQNDILSLPYPDDNEEIKLNFWEQALVGDVGSSLIDFRRKGETATILQPTEEADLTDFAEMYCRILNAVYENFRSLPPLRFGSFICYPFCYGQAPQISLPEPHEVIPYLEELLRHQLGSRLLVNRILRLYEQNVVFMIKPDQKRYWLRSIALRDADETLVDLLEQGY
jgi:hypothetical protein